MSYSERDYQKLAQAIVDDYTKCQIPLRDSLVKVADTHDLNVHETRRLLEQTNVKAHLTLFKEASDHKYIEFDVIDPKEVTQELFGRVEASQGDGRDGEKLAADHYLDLPDEYRADQQEMIEKVAQEAVPEIKDTGPAPYEGDRGYKAYALTNKVASELKSRIYEKYMDYREEIEKIASEYTSIYADDFEEFEKDAYALHGDDANHVLTSLCSMLNREPSVDRVKTAHYVIDKPVHTKLARAVDMYRDLADHLTGWHWYQTKMDPLLDD